MAISSKDRELLLAINENNLGRAMHWVEVIDLKATFVLTLVLVVIGFLISRLEGTSVFFAKLWLSHEYGLTVVMGSLLLGAASLLVTAATYLLIIIYPKRQPHTQQASVFFYESVSKMAAADFSRKMKTIKVTDAIEGLSDQTYNISKVVSAKFDQLSMSIKYFSISLIIFLLYAVLETLLSRILM